MNSVAKYVLLPILLLATVALTTAHGQTAENAQPGNPWVISLADPAPTAFDIGVDHPILLASDVTTSGSFNPQLPVLSMDVPTTQEDNNLGKQGDKLQVTFELPIWFAGITGNVGVRGFSTPVNSTFVQILQATDSVVGLGGRLEADYGPWICYGDGLYMKLAKSDIAVGPASLDFLSSLSLADIGILYQFGTWTPMASENGPNASDMKLSVAAGLAARYMHVGLNLNTIRGASRNQNQDWADPLASGQVKLDLDKHWQILTRGDSGGGAGAQLTWSAATFLSYQFALSSKINGEMKLGYQAVGEDYHNGSGFQRFTWDAVMHGPTIVLGLQF